MSQGQQIFLAIFIFVVSTHAYQDIWRAGQCRNVQSMTNYDPKKHLVGMWYEHKFTNNYIIPSDARCLTTISYYLAEHSIEGHFYWITAGNKQYEKLSGSVNAKTKDFKEGVGRFVYEPLLAGAENEGIPVIVLATDNENYGVVYSCKQQEELISEMFLVYKRERSSTAYDDIIGNILSQAGVDYSQFKERNQTNCPPIDTTI